MKRYIRSTIDFSKLSPIRVDKHWMYTPFDDSEVFENPIAYAGDKKAKEVVKALHGWDYDVVSEEVESVDLDDLESVQAFVTKDGLLRLHEGNGEKPYAVRFKGRLYLMNGNHRVARAFLEGARSYDLNVWNLQRV